MTAQNPQTPASKPSKSAPESALLESSDANALPITQEQAKEILADLKQVKQRLLWVLIIMGFFAARAIFFHY